MRKILICFLVWLIIAGVFPLQVAFAADNNYTVSQGDNLYRVSLKAGTTVDAIMKANNLADTTIFVGQVLQLPVTTNSEIYVVQAGDNLYRIALNHNLDIGALKAYNNLTDDIIKTGQKLNISAPGTKSLVTPVSDGSVSEPVVKPVQVRESSTQVISKKVITEGDKQLLAKLIYAEARGETISGQTAVGAVIINRLRSPQFPKNIKDIIYEKRGNVYQFSPVQNGSINMEPDTTAFKAADDALQGNDPTNGALFFYNPDKTDDQWIRTLPEKHRIGNHIFAK